MKFIDEYFVVESKLRKRIEQLEQDKRNVLTLQTVNSPVGYRLLYNAIYPHHKNIKLKDL